MFKLPDQDFKAAIIKILKQAIMNMLETKVKIESVSKDIEDRKKNQTEILEWK